MLLRLLLGIGGPLFKILGVTALEQAMAELKAQFDAIEGKQREFEARLAKMESDRGVIVHGLEMMHEARKAGRHAAAADPELPGEEAAARARRLFPEAAAAVDEKRKAANVEGDGEEPPESHV